MDHFSAQEILLAICGLVVLSYLFSILHKISRIPSVLLLLGAGILMRYAADTTGIRMHIPSAFTEILGTLGLIMIVLEAGLDLEVRRSNLPIIINALRSALLLLVLSTVGVGAVLKWWIPEASWIQVVLYALPLCVVSSAIVLSSVHHLSDDKREFLVYEASFSDVLGIMVFNFLATHLVFNLGDVLVFLGSVPLALVLSVFVCFGLMWLLVNSRIGVRFFLVFSVLVIIYVGGKSLHLPSLLTILLFGLVVNNWHWLKWPPLKRYFSDDSVSGMASFLNSITAETAFLVRTFFFIVFGFSIELSQMKDPGVWWLGGAITGALLVLRFVYLRILHRYELFPELLYFPRGLVNVLLFYKIPATVHLPQFSEGVLFFVVLATNVLMMIGSVLYRDKPEEWDHGERASPSARE